MDLRSKLARLGPLNSPAAVEASIQASFPSGLESALSPPAAHVDPFLSVASLHGAVSLTEQRFEPGTRHGRVELSAARRVAGATLAHLALDESLSRGDASRMLLVDTETTGLHQGSGTLPFLIGLAWFEGEALVVQQLFLKRPGEEAPLLHMLVERMACASFIVTFNGKSFDWPLLRTRLAMNRVAAGRLPPHLDLLHCARRVFKRRLKSTRLQDLERGVLGFEREGDIDGSMIPAIYFDWLARGVPTMVERVFEHNANDVVSLAALLSELSRRVERVGDDDAPEDCLSLAELALRRKDAARAEALALLAAERSGTGQTAFDALRLSARLAARRREFQRAAQHLEAALAITHVEPRGLEEAHLALARLYEHRLKNRQRALEHAWLGARAEGASLHSKRVARLVQPVAQAKPRA